MNFADSDLLTRLDAASSEQLEGLPFGLVKVDGEGRVLVYNAWEAALSGLSAGTVRGQSFFLEVAPCTNNFMVAERYAGDGALDETVDYVFTYKLAPTKVRLRLLRGGGSAHAYLLVERR